MAGVGTTAVINIDVSLYDINNAFDVPRNPDAWPLKDIVSVSVKNEIA